MKFGADINVSHRMNYELLFKAKYVQNINDIPITLRCTNVSMLTRYTKMVKMSNTTLAKMLALSLSL